MSDIFFFNSADRYIGQDERYVVWSDLGIRTMFLFLFLSLLVIVRTLGPRNTFVATHSGAFIFQ